MEKDLDERQNKELNIVSHGDSDSQETEQINNNMEAEVEEDQVEMVTKVTRAQRRRNKKHEEDKEREKRILEQEEVNKQGPRILESAAIKEILKSNDLDIFNIPADGNCLYCAVNHQLETTGRETSTVSKLRKMTAEFMRQHKEDFLPFMYND
ncbi:otu domain containing protein [Holotrichia oblita]|nr:otu domain containing protein [Holotrichia oblita]